jgi:PAS domain S-box-containing protein
MVTSTAVLSVATGVVVGVDSIRREFAGARLFFGAWAVLMLGVLTLALHNAGLVPSNALTANSLLIGSALEMVLLSFALADRINVARRFKEKAQARIAAEHAMVEAVTRAQEQLHVTLREREAVLDALPVGIALAAGKRLEWVNREFARLAGYPAEVLVGRAPPDLFVDGVSWERLGKEADAALAAGRSHAAEQRLRRRHGKVLRVGMRATWLVPGDPAQGVIWTVVDVAARGRNAAPAAAPEQSGSWV